VSLNASQVTAGQASSVSADVTFAGNNTAAAATVDVTGQDISNQTGLTTGSDGEVNFTVNATGTSDITVTADRSDAASDSATITVQEATDGGSNTTNFVVSNVSPDGANVTQGQTVDVTADIENTGGADGTQTVGFRLDTSGDGQLDASEELVNQSVQRDAGENSSVTFSVDTSALPNETVTYDHGVFSQNDSDTATITVEEDGTAISALIQIDLTADRDVQTAKIPLFSETPKSASYTLLPHHVYNYTRIHNGELR